MWYYFSYYLYIRKETNTNTKIQNIMNTFQVVFDNINGVSFDQTYILEADNKKEAFEAVCDKFGIKAGMSASMSIYEFCDLTEMQQLECNIEALYAFMVLTDPTGAAGFVKSVLNN